MGIRSGVNEHESILIYCASVAVVGDAGDGEV